MMNDKHNISATLDRASSLGSARPTVGDPGRGGSRRTRLEVRACVLVGTLLLIACGSRRTETGETNGECDDCTSAEPAPCESGACIDDAGDGRDTSNEVAASSETGGSPDDWASLPAGTNGGGPTAGDTQPSAACVVASVEYPQGALVPLDGCGASVCTCDASGALVDCSEASGACAFDGTGPIRPCDELFPEFERFDAKTPDDGYIIGETLFLNVPHPSGCSRPEYHLCFVAQQEAPHRYDLYLLHEAEPDCSGPVQDSLQFDLTPMRDDLTERFEAIDGYILTQYGVYTFGDLTCTQREWAAGVDVADVLGRIDGSCSTDDDCVSTHFSAGCTEACNVVSRVDQLFVLEQLNEVLEAGACAGYVELGCSPQFPQCEPQPAVCTGGYCQLATP